MSKEPRTLYVGIDPGLQGAIAIIYPNGSVTSWHTPVSVLRKKLPRAKTKQGNPKVKTTSMYGFREMHLLLYALRKSQKGGRCRVVLGIERQSARESDSKHTILAVGRNQGIWEALAGANGLEYSLVEPSAWKPRYLPKGSPKQASLDLAVSLYPAHDFKRNPKTGELYKKEEARAEAVLIADFCRRREEGAAYPREVSKSRRK